MSYFAQYSRIAYIHRRLKYKKDYPSTKTLAKDYLEESGDEFSTKTFSRDIEQLKNQNAPIEYDKSRKGYYYTDDTYDLPSMFLTEGDLLALLVIDRALISYRNSPFYERLEKIFNGLKEYLPKNVSVHSGEMADNFSIIPEPVTNISGNMWECIREGMEQGRSLVIKYRAPGFDNAVKRVIDPYHLAGFKGEWYLISRSQTDDDTRVYALSRIVSCSIDKNRFNLPAGFSPDDYFDPAFGIFTSEGKSEVSIKFYPPTSSVIKERIWHPDQKIEEFDDGSIVLKFTTNQLTQILYWVSSWGPGAEILAPEELRKKAAKWFSEAKERYFE